MPSENTGTTFSEEQHKILLSAAIKDAEDKAEAKFSSEITNLQEQLKVSDGRAKEAEAKLKEIKLSAEKAEAENIVNKAIDEGKLLPAQKEFALGLLKTSTKIEFGEGGEEKTNLELFTEMINAGTKQVDLSEKGSGDTAEGKKGGYATVGEEVDERVKEKIKASAEPLGYGDAMKLVFKEDEDLKQRYALI